MSKKHISKKQRLLAGVCIPLAAAGVALGTAAIFLTRKTPVTPSKGDYKVSFYTDESSHFLDTDFVEQRVYAGTTLDRILQPAVQSYRPNFMFAGWLNEAGNAVPGKYKITKDTKLTASFGDTTTGDYQTITFKTKPTETGVSLHGNVSVAVKKGYLFMMVNRPTAEWGDNYFECWQTYDEATGEYVDIDENTLIDKNLILYPRFTKAVTMTWNPGKGGRILRGQATTRLASGTQFSKFNQPQLVNDNLDMVFECWCKDEACETKWQEGEIVTSDATAYAKWKTGTKPSEDYHLLAFEENAEQSEQGFPTPIFSPSTTTLVGNGTKWGKATKPQVTTADGNYELVSWQYFKPEGAGGTWEELDDEHTFTTSGDVYSTRIRPVMQSSISGVSISGESTVLPESDTKYTAIVAGTETNPGVDQDVTWEIFYDQGASKPVPKNYAELDSTGRLTVKSVTNGTTLYLRATSNAAKTQLAWKEVVVQMPYVASQRIWYHNGTQWFSISQKDGLCDGEVHEITATALNSKYGVESETINKYATFENKIYIGRQLTELFQQFGYNWEGFNAEIDFGDNLKTIKSSFLENCINFNKTLDLSHIVTIGDNFLCGCESFGAPGEGATAHDAVITFGNTLQSIGKNFLMNCINYNRKITLPNVEFDIDDGFLLNCYNFNQNITIPANVTEVGDFFMMGCDSFTSNITVASASTYFVDNMHSISSTEDGADIYNYGFTVDGDGAEAFVEKFPTHASDNSYRRIKGSVTPTGVQVNDMQWYDSINYIFGESLDALNFTCQIPSTFGGGTAKVDTNKLQLEQQSGTINLYTKSTETWHNGAYINRVYDGKAYAFDNIEQGPLPTAYKYAAGLFATSFLTDFPYTNGTEGDPYWRFNENTGKYEMAPGKTFHIYENGKAVDVKGVEVEFDLDDLGDPVLKMITINYDGKKLSWTYSDVQTTEIGLPKTDDSKRVDINAEVAPEEGTTVTQARYGDVFNIISGNPKCVLFNTAGVTLTAGNTWKANATYIELELFDMASGLAEHTDISGSNYSIRAFDTTGKEIDLSKYKASISGDGKLFVDFGDGGPVVNDLLFEFIVDLPEGSAAEGQDLVAQVTIR